MGGEEGRERDGMCVRERAMEGEREGARERGSEGGVCVWGGGRGGAGGRGGERDHGGALSEVADGARMSESSQLLPHVPAAQ